MQTLSAEPQRITWSRGFPPVRNGSRVRFFLCFRLFVLMAVILLLVPLTLPAQIAPVPDTPVTSPSVSAGTSSSGQPAVRLRGWSCGDELTPSSTDLRIPAKLSPGSSNLVLFFDSERDPASPVEFRYRLEGYDHDWTVTRNHIGHYRQLPPGDYVFQVQAHIPGREWQTAVVTFSVHQEHFFYQARYFYMLPIVGIVLLAIEIFRRRDQLIEGQVVMVLNERNRIASDCHDTLMAGFAAVSWQLEATSKLLAGPEEKTRRAAQSCELARKMVAHCQAEARRIIGDLRDSDEITVILSAALSRAFIARSDSENLDIIFEMEGDEVPIAPAAVHHLACIGQEAVTNALRHSGTTRILVRLQYASDSLALSIRDNGRGFQFHDGRARTGHFGLLVMQERARKLGAVLSINTVPGVGTEIAAKVAFKAVRPQVERHQQILSWIGV